MLINIGIIDRTFRLIAGLLVWQLPRLLVAGEEMPAALEAVSEIAAAYLVLTGIFRFCPVYAAFGVNTCITSHIVGRK